MIGVVIGLAIGIAVGFILGCLWVGGALRPVPAACADISEAVRRGDRS